jgi:hypothetical protein
MAKKYTRKPRTSSTTKAAEPKPKPKNRSVVSNEKIVHNGNVMNRGVIGVQRFPKDTKFFLQNESYVEEFKVIEETRDSGTDHRRIRGGPNDVVVSLAYLQSQHALGNLKYLDESGNIIQHTNNAV